LFSIYKTKKKKKKKKNFFFKERGFLDLAQNGGEVLF